MIERRLVSIDEIADLSWGDTSVTKKAFVHSGPRYLAYSASGPDGHLPYFDYDRVGVVISAIGANAGATWLAKGKWSCIKNTMRLYSRDESVADTQYIYWATRNPGTWPLRGSAQPFVSQGDARKVQVALPRIEEQRAIAATLGALDDKIESNRQITTKILELGRALFEGALALGKRQAAVAEVSVFHNRRRVPLSSRERDSRRGSIPYYGATGIFGYVDDYLFDEILVLVGEDGSVVRADGGPVLQYIWGKSWINNHAHPLTGHGISNELLYLALDRSDIRPLVTGAVQAKVSMGNLQSLEIELPTEHEQTRLESSLSALFSVLRSKFDEIHHLENMRDTLLPELLSGRIRLPEAREAVQEVNS